jgi:CDP-diacylglycerol--serine O-phosphatidyltransferase
MSVFPSTRTRLRDRRFGQRLHRHAGAVPGAVTLGNMLCGFAATLLAARGEFAWAAWLIVAAWVLDGIDGRVARMVGVSGRFGEQLDALADAVSFGVAPSALVFHMGLHQLGKAGWAACFLFTACGVLRLARFNSSPVHDIRYFLGIPIPFAAAMAVAPAALLEGRPFPSREWAAVHAVVMVISATLMVSRIRFRTFKDLRFGPKPYRQLAAFAALICLFVIEYRYSFLGLIALYLISPLFDRAPAARGETESLSTETHD